MVQTVQALKLNRKELNPTAQIILMIIHEIVLIPQIAIQGIMMETVITAGVDKC
jgi:hypothetical protein